MNDRIRIWAIITGGTLEIYVAIILLINHIFDIPITFGWVILIMLLIIVVALMILVMLYQITRSKGKFEYREYLLDELNPTKIDEKPKAGRKGSKKENKNDEADEKTWVVSEKSDKKDIIALMLKNNDETKEYFKISKNQAKSSFWFSIIACIVGIAMIGISLYGVFKMKDTQFAIIGIVGGAITELIAGTVLVIHNKSALQLNYYYDALHENEKFLSAINLADKLDDDTKRDMYIEIIMAQIQSVKDYKKEEQNSGKNSD